MSEVARNIRRRFKQTNLNTPSANSNSPNLGVYSNQRVIPRTQRTDRGVSQFLSDISGMISNNYRDKVLNQAEIDAATGEETEEYQNNALYRQTVATAQAKRDGIELATRVEAELEDEYTARIENGEEFSVEDFVASRFQEAAAASSDENYQSAMARIQGQVVESLIPKAAAIDAARQAREADETATDIVYTTFENAQDPADIDEAARILDTTLDELGLSNKDKRGIILSGYLNEIDKATDSERVEMLSNKINTWLRKEDRGLLRRNSDDIRSVVDGAKRRIEIADQEARRKNAAEYDDNYLKLSQRVQEDPLSVSVSEINAQAERLGVTDSEVRSRRMRLLEARQNALQNLQQQQEAQTQKASAFSRITEAISGQDGMVELDSEDEQYVDDYLEAQGNALFRAPRQSATGEELPSAIDLLNQAAQDPTPENMAKVAELGRQAAQYVTYANKLGRTPKAVKDMIPNVSPDHPRFRAAAMLYSNLESKGVAADIGLNEEAEARYTAYNDLLKYVSPGEAADYMVASEDSNISQATFKRAVENEMDEGEILEQILGDSDAENSLAVRQEVLDLAARIMPYSPGGPEKALELATAKVAAKTSVLDGIAVSNRVVDPLFSREYNKGDNQFRASIQLDLENRYNTKLPENWKLRPAPNAGRSGYLSVYDPETGSLMIDPDTGRALLINPRVTVGRYARELSDQTRAEAIERLGDVMSGKARRDATQEAIRITDPALRSRDIEEMENLNQ